MQLYCLTTEHPRYEMDTHWHDSLELIRVVSGTLEIRLDDRNYVAKSGDIYLSNIETMHGARPNNCEYECIVFDVLFFSNSNYFIKNFINDLLIKNIVLSEKIELNSTKKILNELFFTLKEKAHGYQFSAMGLMQQFFGEIIKYKLYKKIIQKDFSHTPNSIIKLKKALTFIRENYDKPITLNDITNTTGFSNKYFCMFFKKMTNRTPIDYLNVYRIEMASKKIINTDLSITEIAFSCGFNDLSYFIKTFKKITGVTPRKYKE